VAGRIFLTCYSGYGLDPESPGDQGQLRLHLICADRATGKIRWDKTIMPKLPEQKYGRYMKLHGYASSTPVSDGKAVFAFFGHTGVVAFDLKGRQLWKADVGSRTHGFGSGTSPILFKNLVIVNASVESRSLAALDKATGNEVWRADGIRDSWNTPVLVAAGAGKQELVVDTKDKLLAFDPESGRPLWNCLGPERPRYICPSAIARDGIVYAVHGYFGPLVAVRAGGRGDVGQSHQLWRSGRKMGSNVPSPVYCNGRLYWVNEKGGVASCADAKTGERVYRDRIRPDPGLIYASPIVADGKIYYVSRERGTYVLAAKPEFELLAHNRISSDDSVFNASPAISNGQLLLRSDKFLYCIGTK